MGFKGAKPFCESLSTFFSEESRGPSRPERQVKRDLRGKSQAEKGKRQKKKRAHKRMAGSGSADQTKRRSIRQPTSREQGSGIPAEKSRGTVHKSRHNSGRPRKNDQPATWRGTLGAEKPLRTGKIRVRSFACPEGPCETGPPKNRFAVFGWHGLFLLRAFICCALRRTRRCTKGAPPPFIPCKLFEKSLTKNFTVWAVCSPQP